MTQPEALKSANEKQKECHMLSIKSAAELRRLHESNTELLAELKDMGARYGLTLAAQAAIAKAEGESRKFEPLQHEGI
jgi:hypothetical protein